MYYNNSVTPAESIIALYDVSQHHLYRLPHDIKLTCHYWPYTYITATVEIPTTLTFRQISKRAAEALPIPNIYQDIYEHPY